MDKRLLDTIVCPKCHNVFEYNKEAQQLICSHDQLVFTIEDNIPVLLESLAKPLMATKELG